MRRTETNTVEMERHVMAAATRELQWREGHHHMSVDFEHGQWWVTDIDTGAQWSVCDTADGFCFEQVSKGEED